MASINGAEVAKHNNKESCWIVVDSNVYDVTSFLSEHPGGAAIILKNAGTDASREFKMYHPLDYLRDNLSSNSLLGPVDPDTFGQLRQPKEEKAALGEDLDSSKEIPHVTLCVSTPDFENAAKAVLPHKSYIYASGSANTGASLQGNLDDWGRINFRPRVMRNVGDVDTRRKMFGYSSPHPFYISPMGTMGAMHPGAEPEMIRGAIRKGTHVVVSTSSTKSSEQIMQCYIDEQERLRNESPTTLFYQYYMPVDRTKAIELMQLVKKCGYKGLWITVDTPVLGKRTKDRYLQAEEALAVGLGEETTAEWETGSDNAFAPAMGGRPVQGQLSPHTTWDDLEWIRNEWDGPIVLKGIQCAEDAKLAMEYGCNGILLSNHGGRQLHTAPSALMTLLEIRTYSPEVLGKLEIYLDGGLRDGNDILKALCLGATAVGVGRPFLYALAAYGTKGVERCVDVLAEELQTGMRLLGITSLDQCRPEMVNASRVLNEMWRPEQLSIKSRL
ncbi:mitochondrial cytochrome-like protein b2 [Dothidotthia symphoricarpi CBS 119687]|uniref:Mitochondrial cytochrome-like protein b2 n=1 Tax=Dothidotthia symphoricarpi CBS 119687 TaxID=1392245 RepID=A0A6A6ACU3_9PLEO|nr:mitochondrial cytochrome-like protein b2 [Dothidotthia symphoricarpi CBS 119687]KAF2129386.1 mitochondrial cytochrome-like protein b2 [Dothidotthia symphoricarpi CBS 119687]